MGADFPFAALAGVNSTQAGTGGEGRQAYLTEGRVTFASKGHRSENLLTHGMGSCMAGFCASAKTCITSVRLQGHPRIWVLPLPPFTEGETECRECWVLGLCNLGHLGLFYFLRCSASCLERVCRALQRPQKATQAPITPELCVGQPGPWGQFPHCPCNLKLVSEKYLVIWPSLLNLGKE